MTKRSFKQIRESVQEIIHRAPSPEQMDHLNTALLAKSHEQVIVTHSKESDDLGYFYGGAKCPFCDVLSFIVPNHRRRLELDPKCSHANMLVDAGFPSVAIHFENRPDPFKS